MKKILVIGRHSVPSLAQEIQEVLSKNNLNCVESERVMHQCFESNFLHVKQDIQPEKIEVYNKPKSKYHK